MFRIGIGFDAHRFTKDRELVLGGISIQHHSGLEGHSDADVLVHAICDSLLGALGRNDIGHYFPDYDPENKDISSLVILQRTGDIVNSDGFVIENIDTVIICEEPRIKPHIEKMKSTISDCLGIESRQVGIKSTTTEKMGFTGRQEGIAAKSVALIRQL